MPQHGSDSVTGGTDLGAKAHESGVWWLSSPTVWVRWRTSPLAAEELGAQGVHRDRLLVLVEGLQERLNEVRHDVDDALP